MIINEISITGNQVFVMRKNSFENDLRSIGITVSSEPVVGYAG